MARKCAQEKNEANLVQQNIEADEQSDPMFRRMAAAFDAGGAKGLLLSHLPLAEAGGRLWLGCGIFASHFRSKDKRVMITQLGHPELMDVKDSEAIFFGWVLVFVSFA